MGHSRGAAYFMLRFLQWLAGLYWSYFPPSLVAFIRIISLSYLSLFEGDCLVSSTMDSRQGAGSDAAGRIHPITTSRLYFLISDKRPFVLIQGIQGRESAAILGRGVAVKVRAGRFNFHSLCPFKIMRLIRGMGFSHTRARNVSLEK